MINFHSVKESLANLFVHSMSKDASLNANQLDKVIIFNKQDNSILPGLKLRNSSRHYLIGCLLMSEISNL